MLNPSIQYRLNHQYQQIDYLLDGHHPSFLIKRHKPEKWSIHEHLAHLGRYQTVFVQRVDKMLIESYPDLGQYRAENDPVFPKWVKKDTYHILEQTKQDRQNIVYKLSGLREIELARRGRHPNMGLLSISELTEFFLMHESHHFFTIYRLIVSFRQFQT